MRRPSLTPAPDHAACHCQAMQASRSSEAPMSDFYQNGVVTVLHRLGQPNVDQLERELTRYGRVNPIALVLPSLYAELGRPAFKAIVETLKSVPHLNDPVISLHRPSAR